MIRRSDTTEPRSPDGAIVRALDGQASADERRWLDTAPPGGEVAARTWELREASERFSELVAAIPIPELPDLPAARLGHRPRHVAKAAAIGLMFVSGTAVAMPGPRGVLVQAVTAVAGWVAGTPTLVEREERVSEATVTFTPAGAEGVTVRIERAQAGGSVRFEQSEGGQWSARASASTELVVLPNGLLVRNDPASLDDVVVRVPRGVRSIVLSIGGASSETVELAGDRSRSIARR